MNLSVRTLLRGKSRAADKSKPPSSVQAYRPLQAGGALQTPPKPRSSCTSQTQALIRRASRGTGGAALARTIALGGHGPGRAGRPPTGGAALTTAVRVVHRIHRYAAHVRPAPCTKPGGASGPCRALGNQKATQEGPPPLAPSHATKASAAAKERDRTQMARDASFAQLPVLMLLVAHSADCGATLQVNLQRRSQQWAASRMREPPGIPTPKDVCAGAGGGQAR